MPPFTCFVKKKDVSFIVLFDEFTVFSLYEIKVILSIILSFIIFDGVPMQSLFFWGGAVI